MRIGSLVIDEKLGMSMKQLFRRRIQSGERGDEEKSSRCLLGQALSGKGLSSQGNNLDWKKEKERFFYALKDTPSAHNQKRMIEKTIRALFMREGIRSSKGGLILL